jgi:hypothetical protein
MGIGLGLWWKALLNLTRERPSYSPPVAAVLSIVSVEHGNGVQGMFRASATSAMVEQVAGHALGQVLLRQTRPAIRLCRTGRGPGWDQTWLA